MIENEGVTTITINFNLAVPEAVSIPYLLTGTAVKDLDYSITASPLVFAAGEKSKTITITPLYRAGRQGDRTVILTLGEPSRGRIAGNRVYQATIQDLVVVPVATVSSESQTVVEDDGTATITVDLSQATDVSVSVPYAMSGTAVNPTDYTISPESPLVFTAGQTTKDITLTLINRTGVQPSLTAIATLGTPTNATRGTPYVHTVTIEDSAYIPTVTVAQTSQTVFENCGTSTFNVVLDNPTTVTVTVPFVVSGTAEDGTDYSITSSPLVFTAGQTSKTITITVVDRIDFPGDRTVITTLETPTNGVLGGDYVNTTTIQDVGTWDYDDSSIYYKSPAAADPASLYASTKPANGTLTVAQPDVPRKLLVQVYSAAATNDITSGVLVITGTGVNGQVVGDVFDLQITAGTVVVYTSDQAYQTITGAYISGVTFGAGGGTGSVVSIGVSDALALPVNRPATTILTKSITQKLMLPFYFKPSDTSDGWSGGAWAKAISLAPQTGIIIFNPAAPTYSTVLATQKPAEGALSITQLDCPRQVNFRIISAAAPNDITAGTLSLVGLDEDGGALSQDIDLAAGGAGSTTYVTTTPKYASITSITISGLTFGAGGGTGSTLKILGWYSAGPGSVSMVSDYSASITAARAAGIKVLGYIYAGYQERTVDRVLDDIDNYYSWYSGCGLDGIFVDEVSCVSAEVDAVLNAAQIAFYTSINNAVKAQNANDITVLNPGAAQDYSLNAVCDINVAYEGTSADFENWAPPVWQFGVDSSRKAALVHTAGTSDTNHRNAVLRSRTLDFGYVYVTDRSTSIWGGLDVDPYLTNVLPYVSDTTLQAKPSSLVMCTAANDIGYLYFNMKINPLVRTMSDKYPRLYIASQDSPTYSLLVDAGSTPANNTGEISANFLVEGTGRYERGASSWSWLGTVSPTTNAYNEYKLRVSRANFGNKTCALKVILRPQEWSGGIEYNRYSPVIDIPAMGLPTSGDAFAVSAEKANGLSETVGTLDLLAGTVVPTTSPDGETMFQFTYTIAANP